MIAEENVWFEKAIPTVRVQEMESQQDKQHLQAPAKMIPLASQKITYKQVTVYTPAAQLIYVPSAQSGGRNTVIIKTVQLAQARPQNACCGSFKASSSFTDHDINTKFRVVFIANPARHTDL